MDFFNGSAIQARNVYQVNMSPEMAADILHSRNGKNRNLSEELVKRLVSALIADKWTFNGQPIVFDDSGSLIDGQHRLSAIVRAKRSAECLVVTDISDPMAFHTIDDGKKRGLFCNISSMGFSNSKVVASIGKLFYTFCHSKDLTRFVISTHTEQNIILAEFISKIPEINEAALLANRTSKLCNASVLGAALLIFLKIDPEKARLFHNMLCESEYPYPDHPVKQLHNRLFRDRLSSNKLNNLERLALIFKAWNYFMKGKSVKEIRWSRRRNPDQDFPIPYGWTNQ